MSTTTNTMGLTCPSVNDETEATIEALAENFSIIDSIWPVGSIYMSTVNTNPSNFIGGTWTALQGRFLVGAGNDFAAGSTGGSKTMGIQTCGQEATGYGLTNSSSGFTNRVLVNASGYSNRILPPYLAVYMWERTA